MEPERERVNSSFQFQFNIHANEHKCCGSVDQKAHTISTIIIETHTFRRFDANNVDASLIELIKILSRRNGIVNIIHFFCFCLC